MTEYFPTDEELFVQRALIYGPSVMAEAAKYSQPFRANLFLEKHQLPDEQLAGMLIAPNPRKAENLTPETVQEFSVIMENLGLHEVAPLVYALDLRRAMFIARKQRGLTQEKVAHQIGLQPSAISAFETGKLDTPYVQYRIKSFLMHATDEASPASDVARV